MRKPPIGAILLLLWGIFLTAAVYGYLAWLQPSRLSSTVCRFLEEQLSVPCRIGTVSFSLLPLPTVHAQDISLLRGSKSSMELHIRSARLLLSYQSLLRLEPVIHSAVLEDPTLDISSDLLNIAAPQQEQTEKAVGDFFSSLPSGLAGMRVQITNGLFRMTGVNGKDHLELAGISLNARMPGLFPGKLDLDIKNISLAGSSGFSCSAERFRISVPTLKRQLHGGWSGKILFDAAVQIAPLDALMGGVISDPYRYFPMPEPLKVSLKSDVSLSPEQTLSLEGLADFSAQLIMNKSLVPLSLSVPFHTKNAGESLHIEDAEARMENDHVTISGTVTGLSDFNPILKGRADIHHFSLPRWFGFSQAMDPGLQHALDSIQGTFEGMELSLRGIVVPSLTANVQGIALEGEGSCRDFLNPEILISAHAKNADLNRIFPELRGRFPDMSHLPLPVLPLSEEKDSAPPSVGYDIHISADEADIMDFHASGADVHVVPAPEGHPMLKIAVSGLYGGKALSTVHIVDKIRVIAELDRISMSGVTKALAGYPAITGLLKKGSVDLSFRPGSAPVMLSTLEGSLKGSLEKGSFMQEKSKASLPYESLSLSACAAASSPEKITSMPPTMNFIGDWNIHMAAKGWSVAAEAKQASMAFSTKNGLPASINRQPISLKGTIEPSANAMPARKIAFTASGKGSFSAENKNASLSEAILQHDNFTLSGNLSATRIPDSLSLAGKISLSTNSLKKAAELFGIELPSPSGSKSFEKAHIGADLTLTSDQLSLERIKGSIDDIAMEGTLHYSAQKRPSWNGKLSLSSLDIDRYLPKPLSSASSEGGELPLRFLKETDLNLSLSVARLRAVSTTFTKVSLPLSQKDGTLRVPFTASLPGGGSVSGNMQANLEGSGQTAVLSLAAHCRNMDMMNFCTDRKQETRIGGMGTFSANLSARMKRWNDWKHTLGGSMAFSVENGAIVTRQEPLGDLPARDSRTDFKTMLMTIALKNGIAACNDFLIKGSPLTITGKGTVDLAEETIQAKATVTLAGIPEMPLSISGNLFSPKISYQILGAVAGTVGNIGSGIIDLVGGVLTAPFRLFAK